MASLRFFASITTESISEVEKRLEPSTSHGADLRFHGVVRDRENGREISGIDYSFYEDMALKELNRIGEAMTAEFPGHLALVHHKIGFVAVGEASILIRVQTAHSAEGFEISREYLRRIKETVPIWKKPVFLA
ncbi:MAG: molybdenum cofactor biosynthesis protein MoaE [Verrucomicrobiales bacterium]|jgi:molybdopterin synthase catalytic subunit|nr:molybdenum cofactor biosynthesis protein MoaE [Verrucomicrobiales bacterium]